LGSRLLSGGLDESKCWLSLQASMVIGNLRHSAFWIALTGAPHTRHQHNEDKLGVKAGREDWAWRITVARTVAVGVARCLGRLSVSLLAVALCCGLLLLLLLSVGMLPAFVHLPVELFYWPQSAALGGAGFPLPSELQVSLLLNYCPVHRPLRASSAAASTSPSVIGKKDMDVSALSDEEGIDGLSIRRGPRFNADFTPNLMIFVPCEWESLSQLLSNRANCGPSSLWWLA